MRLIEDVKEEDKIVDAMYSVLTSFITEKISNYNSSLYYSNRSYLKACYEEGMILD